MMRKHILLPALALLGGAVGSLLRRWQLGSAFEADTGLAIPGAPSTLAVAGFSLLLLLVLLLLSLKVEKRLPWEAAFAAGKENPLAATALILSAMLLLAGAGAEAVTHLVNGSLPFEGETPFARIASAALPPLRMVLSVGALPCIFLWARALLRGDTQRESLAPLEPCLLYCVWLVSIYQLRAADPVVQDYLYEVLAITVSLLGLYFITGHSFGNGKPRQTVFFCLAGAYFSLVALADGPSLANAFRFLFAAIYLTTHATLILNHPPVEEQEAPAEAEREADKNA